MPAIQTFHLINEFRRHPWLQKWHSYKGLDEQFMGLGIEQAFRYYPQEARGYLNEGRNPVKSVKTVS
jgi:hypothetical protein